MIEKERRGYPRKKLSMGSGSSSRKGVEVQVLSSAPNKLSAFNLVQVPSTVPTTAPFTFDTIKFPDILAG